MSCKNRFPFRVGTTSHIIPDDIIPNIEYLKDKVDDVELVLFESDEMSNLPSESDMTKLRKIGRAHDLTYSVHLPLDVYLGSADSAVRKRSVEKCCRVIELTEVLNPSAYIMHAEAEPGISISGFSDTQKKGFANNFHASLEKLFYDVSVSPSEFCVETLNYPFEILDEVISALGLSVTLDIGHLELYGFSVDDHLERYLPQTRVLHMHGIENGKDHNGLQHMRNETLDTVMKALSGNQLADRVFTMEIFSEEDLLSSVKELARYWK